MRLSTLVQKMSLFKNSVKRFININKSRTTLIVVVFIFCTIGSVYQWHRVSQDILKTNIVTDWVNDFVGGDFESCDNTPQNGDYRLLSSYNNKYTAELNKEILSTVVTNIALKNITMVSRDDDISVYGITLNIPVYSVSADVKNELEGYRNQYILKEISREEFLDLVSEYMRKSIEGFLTSTQTKEVTLKLGVRSAKDTAMLYYTSDFILGLSNETGLSSVISTYSSEISTIVDEVSAN